MKRARLWQAWVRTVAAIVLIGFSGPGCIVVDWGRVAELLSPKKKKKSKKSTDDDDTPAPRVDLGTARFPSTATTPKSIHLFSTTSLEPPRYELTYMLTDKAGAELEAAYRGYAKSVRFSNGEKHSFRWFPPPGCEHDMGCVFEALAEEDRDALLPLVELFRARQKDEKLDTLKLARLVVSFVQDISYLEPDDEPFGVIAPALVVAKKRGDCDSKSLLAHILLTELGFDTVMLSSDAHRHAMLGIALPVPGTSISYKGREYKFTELTAHNAPIGYLFPNNAKPNDWRVVPLRRPAAQP